MFMEQKVDVYLLILESESKFHTQLIQIVFATVIYTKVFIYLNFLHVSIERYSIQMKLCEEEKILREIGIELERMQNKIIMNQLDVCLTFSAFCMCAFDHFHV